MSDQWSEACGVWEGTGMGGAAGHSWTAVEQRNKKCCLTTPSLFNWNFVGDSFRDTFYDIFRYYQVTGGPWHGDPLLRKERSSFSLRISIHKAVLCCPFNIHTYIHTRSLCQATVTGELQSDLLCSCKRTLYCFVWAVSKQCLAHLYSSLSWVASSHNCALAARGVLTLSKRV